ncbi:FKBP-type peptidyl-prolyl cis-trans isomerase [Cryomorpha ignava]|uniref:Peptidyl-prolyl cis-trans isomerase n=1 Tax=Cryomorpha ignava TaxID=101383 RepID=A0A7K3WNS5_9FLAO|nr:FKBP-type peptidyl-prolyl cis-trans isomerase [Cryomorpha ignava]NEN22661.1 FKBP-type peptidyl-prolyl cis-trans isomerase [Cryomorpha ignava]
MRINLKSFALFAGVLCLMASAACAQKGSKKGRNGSEMKTQMDSVSYALGATMGSNIRTTGIEGVEIDLLMAGIEDALEGDSTMKVTADEGNKVLQAFMADFQKKQAEESKGNANEYMQKAGADGKLQSTESGILYEVVTMGEGPKPAATDKVKVHYEGKTTEGTIFDSSYERGQPAEFPLNRVIPGWTEILQQMPVGSTWIATIPPALAYGERGSPPNIGPNEVLIFKIELLEILPPAEKK